MEIGLVQVNSTENLKFYVQNGDYREEYELIINIMPW